jgi:hypothetical protein
LYIGIAVGSIIFTPVFAAGSFGSQRFFIFTADWGREPQCPCGHFVSPYNYFFLWSIEALCLNTFMGSLPCPTFSFADRM